MLVIALPLHFYPESIFFYTQILYRENTFVASVNFFLGNHCGFVAHLL